MSIFVQYAPYALGEGHWDQLREPFADRCFALLDEYAPNFSRSVLARQVLTPLDIERTFNLTGGNIFQGAMTPSQLFSFRPVPGHADYRTPVRGPLSLRRGHASGRRRHGRPRLQCRARDPPRPPPPLAALER
jgi:phytoene dehydrogenase-like protein